MSRVYVTADWHLHHRNILKYRPQFSSIEEHNNTSIANYNATILKRDTVYFLGDICFTLESLEIIKKLKGRKILIMGNHDLEQGTDRHHKVRLFDVFDDVLALTSRKGVWLSHCPIHPEELRGKLNIHGHSHNHIIDDKRYANVCVEQTNYTPVEFNKIKEEMMK